ncbi:class I SAM-dependent methyltransferase (plasmid) [Burkholderia gladioli pv. gladioli]|uniref:class I SAM-dependent methyltransferase n=1 Tax=Burkholderia gladioli TaxID=28095 RepID=UPI0019380822|nr:class I SAM-dependent methyltransferase [Burkholderia gladioli]MDJ1167657.1 class I SAM-dependent methyltransferase [Burkholderia gladioli pv. gladioli]QPQ88867.1 class I SAM-dependent methyltransferase [Burkholderia gladioli]
MKESSNKSEVASDVWTEADSFDFIRHGHLFIPQNQSVETIIVSILADHPEVRNLLELGCGAGRLMERVLAAFPEAEVGAVDKSAAMLDAARARCRIHGDRARFVQADFEDTSIFGSGDRYDGVFSVLAIHHLTDDAKCALFKRIYGALKPGGVFVYCDMLKPTSTTGWKIAAQEWPREVEAQGRRHGAEDALPMFETLNWNYYADPQGDPSDRPSSLADVMRWSSEAGFSVCDLHWFIAGHGMISAWK